MRSGLTHIPDRTLAWPPRARLILMLGLDDLTPAPQPVLAVLRPAHARGASIAALRGGAFSLAQAGLLDGRRSLTHWALTDVLRTRQSSGICGCQPPLFG
ncbi:hypothetical protein [Streptomyces sp. NPDC093261]|uniref:hypothetical protein n=1 Tax=Streptomyces sp. NPDC093261 TaxID=3366037 RepID=UPI0037FDAA04